MPTSYYTGSVADFDALVNEIEAAADTAGWTTAIEDFVGGTGDDAGRVLTLDSGNDFEVTVRSVADLKDVTLPASWGGNQGSPIDAPGILITAEYTGGSLASAPPLLPVGDNALSVYKYVGPQPYRLHDFVDEPVADTWTAPVFPATYHIFVHTDPDTIVVICQTDAAYFQWLMFGEVVKFGDWQGGGFFGASGVPRITDTGGADPSTVSYSLFGTSRNRSFAPFHRMDADFDRRHHANMCTNTMLHIITGTDEDEIDDFHWSFNMASEPGTLGGGAQALREVVANPWWNPLPSRSPNSHNEVSVMLPYWLATQRESHRCIVGRLAHCRHIPIDNFNPGDTFELGEEEWMVFPYFEREGFTALEGWAIRRSSGS